MANSIKTLLNGVKVYPLEVENDFSEAQDMYNESDVLEGHDVECAYNERIDNNFLGTYEISIERNGDYNRFYNMLNSEQNEKIDEIQRPIYSDYNSNIINHSEASRRLDETRREFNGTKLGSFRFPTMEEWKTGKYVESEKRTLRLGKVLKNVGFSQSVIDFYSQQIKTEKKSYITISDRVQHIAGMSYYVDLDDSEKRWNGYNNSSCQDPRHNYCEVYKLSGALHDDNLFIAMMHDDLEDIEDMTDSLRARTLMRIAEIDGKQVMLALQYYGNNTTVSELENGLKQLHEVGIFERVRGDYEINTRYVGGYEHIVTDEVNVCETIEDYTDVECTQCNGSGEYEIWSERLDKHVEVECPFCGGSGSVSASIYIEIDEWIEVESTTTIHPYREGYSISGNVAEMYVDLDYIRSELEKVKLDIEGNEIDNRMNEWEKSLLA